MPTTGRPPRSGRRKAVRDQWPDLCRTAGRRSVLLLSRDGAYAFLSKVVAAGIATTIRHIPIEVPLGTAEGLSKKCVVNCDNLRTIPTRKLVERISQLRPQRIAEVKRAVGYALGWEELIEARS
jgi:mRNA-degrading endonuclease toxin of MazEF toxin-antitoxin module